MLATTLACAFLRRRGIDVEVGGGMCRILPENLGSFPQPFLPWQGASGRKVKLPSKMLYADLTTVQV
jgi:hypothetical protein